jgi:hypothetical protein
VQERDDREPYDECDKVQRAARDPERFEKRFYQGGHGRLAQGAEAEGGDRDPELADRKVGVEPPRGLLDETGGGPALLDQPVDLRGPYLDEGELRRHEETIQNDQR